jgi:ParB-like chromosome segregation protein Spo0J
MVIEIKKLSDLVAAPYNPRQSTKKQEKHLKESLQKFGFLQPIILNKQTGYIVGGHFRVRELIKMGHKEIECVIVDLSAEDEKELNIRLNANTGDFDWDILANVWHEHNYEEWGLSKPINEADPNDDIKPNDYIKISIQATNDVFIQIEEKLKNICDEFNAIMKVK